MPFGFRQEHWDLLRKYQNSPGEFLCFSDHIHEGKTETKLLQLNEKLLHSRNFCCLQFILSPICTFILHIWAHNIHTECRVVKKIRNSFQIDYQLVKILRMNSNYIDKWTLLRLPRSQKRNKIATYQGQIRCHMIYFYLTVKALNVTPGNTIEHVF